MSKWRDNFSAEYGTSNNVKKLNQEIKDALDQKRVQRETDKALTDVIKGKYRRSC